MLMYGSSSNYYYYNSLARCLSHGLPAYPGGATALMEHSMAVDEENRVIYVCNGRKNSWGPPNLGTGRRKKERKTT